MGRAPVFLFDLPHILIRVFALYILNADYIPGMVPSPFSFRQVPMLGRKSVARRASCVTVLHMPRTEVPSAPVLLLRTESLQGLTRGSVSESLLHSGALFIRNDVTLGLPVLFSLWCESSGQIKKSRFQALSP